MSVETPGLEALCGVRPMWTRVGLDAARIVASGIAPLVTLGMIERTGAHGLLGRGVFRPPVALFRRALDGLAAKK